MEGWSFLHFGHFCKDRPKDLPSGLKMAIYSSTWPVLAPSWRILGSHVEAKTTQKYCKTYYFVKNHFFEDKTLRRRSWDQVGATQGQPKAQKAPQEGPKTAPKRAKNDFKIDIEIGHKTRVARRQVGLVVWARDPPLGGPPGALGGSPSGSGQAPRLHNIYIIHST